MTALISIERHWSPLLWFRSEMMLVAWLREVGMEKEKTVYGLFKRQHFQILVMDWILRMRERET